MDRFLTAARAKQKEIITFIQRMVECESPSGDAAAIARFADLFEDAVRDVARVTRRAGGKFGPHLQCQFQLPGRTKTGQVLVLGHSDTVYPMGTLAEMPFRIHKGRLWGPGVFDMKGGIGFFVYAMRILRELDVPVARRVLLQLNADEEVGSKSSRTLTEKEAGRSDVVLVIEPGQTLAGSAKTARKGVGDYSIRVQGVSAHAGVDFASGASAIVELARQIGRLTEFTDLSKQITVNPGVISGGTRTNVIASEAQVQVDVRVARLKDAAMLDRKLRRLKPFDRRCSLSVTGGLNRPPMERTKAIATLFAKARALASDLGVQLEEASTGGGSDGNFTAALGVPTLDGLGAVGEGAHSRNESMLVDRIADRTALLAKLVAAI